MDNTGKVLTALLVGAAAGAITGLLLAPESGSKTRDKLGKTAGDLADDLEGAWEDGAEKIKDLTDEAISEIEKYSRKTSD
jgi:gas vesicle protein